MFALPQNSPRQLRAMAVRPDFWMGAVCTAIVLWSASQLLLFGFARDQSIYALVGRGILEGDMPYRDRWDFKPPGIFVVYALAEALFGATMWGPRVFEALGLLGTAALLVRLSHVFFADGRPGFFAAAICSLVHVQFEFWHTGQPESFGGFLTIAGLAAATHDAKSQRSTWALWAVCGVCFGLAALMKPPLGGGAVVCAAFLLRQQLNAGQSWPRALVPVWVVGVGSLLPIAAVGLWFWSKGAWPDLYWTLFKFTPGYTKLGWGTNAAGGFYKALNDAFTKFSALIAVGCVGAAFGGPISSRDREGLSLVLGVLALHLAGIAMQAKFFEYHFVASLPLVSFIAGLGWFKIWRVATRERAGGAVAFASLAIVVGMARRPVYDVPEGFWIRSWERTKYMLGLSQLPSRAAIDERFHFAADFNLHADRQVAERIDELTTTNDAIFIWGFEPAIYWLAQRPLASRYIYDVPQRASWESAHARRQLLSDLQRTQPKVIVVQHNDTFTFVTDNDLDSARALPEFPELFDLVTRDYVLIEQIEDFELYQAKNEL